MGHGNKTTWYSSFLGVRMQHNYGLYKVMDDILLDNPQIDRFVEIGTGGGAMSVYFALHAVQRNTHLLTFDIQTRGHKPKVDAVFDKLGVEFVEEDVFDNVQKVRNHMDCRSSFLFCDGGDKYKEFETFAPLMYPGSIICVHDYGDEVLPGQLDGLTKDWEPVLEELWLDKKYELYTCFYKKL